MKIRNVLSTFNGMSCGNIALDKAGIEFDNYYSSEVDKYAIKVTQTNYPNTIQLGDVTKWREWDIDWSTIDLFIGGSPCQGFSFAGKQLAFDDPRSKLFFVFVDILNHIKRFNPSVKFMLENVRMKTEYLNVISAYMKVNPIKINSALISAQNRVRYYWCNWEVNQPNDKGLILSDILEDAYSEREKSLCVLSRVAGATLKGYQEKSRHQMVKSLGNVNPSGRGMNGNVYSTKHKSPTLTTNKGEGVKIGRIVGRRINPDTGKRDDYNRNIKVVQYLESRTDDKSGCITTVQKDNVLTDNNEYWRKLTPIECERLQTVPDNYTNHVSNSQRYKMLGNGWTVDVIAHIFSTMDTATPTREIDVVLDQLEFSFE